MFYTADPEYPEHPEYASVEGHHDYVMHSHWSVSNRIFVFLHTILVSKSDSYWTNIFASTDLFWLPSYSLCMIIFPICP
jgi:hypothetical protein